MHVTFASFDEKIAEQLQSAPMLSAGLAGYLGFRHTDFSAGRLIAEMDARPELLTPFGNLHGGCLSAMVDHCLGVVFYPVIPAGAWVATTEFKLNLLKPVSSGTCIATTDIIALSRRSGVARITITNEGNAVCAAQGTVTIVTPKAGSS
ncbi:PaaI family thioesterase [Mycobacterium asiaticum]|uniref:PaaI family thioesterase n=1 Tax=Mycobacterium asiaticum TaxID=1790 RepID=UPI000AC45A49